MVFIFIKTGAPARIADTWTGLNLQFAPGSEWNKVVMLSPQKKARGERGHRQAGRPGQDVVVPNLRAAAAAPSAAPCPWPNWAATATSTPGATRW